MNPSHSSGTNPLSSAAACFVKLGLPSQSLDKAKVESDLAAQAVQIENGNINGMETMLGAQAQVLHRMFTHAIEKYADHDMMPETARLYGTIGLRAQSHCRQVVAALAGMKHLQAAAEAKLFGSLPKSQNELLSAQFPFKIKESHHAPMDKARTPAASSADTWMAAMDQSWR